MIRIAQQECTEGMVMSTSKEVMVQPPAIGRASLWCFSAPHTHREPQLPVLDAVCLMLLAAVSSGVSSQFRLLARAGRVIPGYDILARGSSLSRRPGARTRRQSSYQPRRPGACTRRQPSYHQLTVLGAPDRVAYLFDGVSMVGYLSINRILNDFK